jgi:hypothetical protein
MPSRCERRGTIRRHARTLRLAVRRHRRDGGRHHGEPTDASRFFDAETWSRLRQVKALYDPADLFKGNHHIPPAN